MNFEFSDESVLLRDQARRFLQEKCSSKIVRGVLEGKEPFAKSLWQDIAALGWLGAAIPEDYGGLGLGYEALCVLAEEMGRVLAPIPFASSIYLAAEAILAAGNEAQKRLLLPKLVAGSAIGTFAFAEGFGPPSLDAIKTHARRGVLQGVKWPVSDGVSADFAVVAARDEEGIGLYCVDLVSPGVERTTLRTFDPSREQARLVLLDVAAERLGATADCWPIVERILERAAILTAFEQVGGAEACLRMARDYAMERYAFGRPIGAFQSIKNKLTDVYVELEIARSNAYYGAWSLSKNGSEIPMAAACARVAAIEAFRIAAKENIQTHAGVGFTWEFDCHLYYRRAKLLALTLGAAPYWKNRLVSCLQTAKTSAGRNRGL